MAQMLPDREIFFNETKGVTEMPSLTYAIDMQREDETLYDEGRITGMCSGLEAMRQAVYKILRTQKGIHFIYGEYGTEHFKLIGKPESYVIPELERMITEALMCDSRITGVDNFVFESGGGKVSASFDVHTVFGDIREEVNDV